MSVATTSQNVQGTVQSGPASCKSWISCRTAFSILGIKDFRNSEVLPVFLYPPSKPSSSLQFAPVIIGLTASTHASIKCGPSSILGTCANRRNFASRSRLRILKPAEINQVLPAFFCYLPAFRFRFGIYGWIGSMENKSKFLQSLQIVQRLILSQIERYLGYGVCLLIGAHSDLKQYVHGVIWQGFPLFLGLLLLIVGLIEFCQFNSGCLQFEFEPFLLRFKAANLRLQILAFRFETFIRCICRRAGLFKLRLKALYLLTEIFVMRLTSLRLRVTLKCRKLFR